MPARGVLGHGTRQALSQRTRRAREALGQGPVSTRDAMSHRAHRARGPMHQPILSARGAMGRLAPPLFVRL